MGDMERMLQDAGIQPYEESRFQGDQQHTGEDTRMGTAEGRNTVWRRIWNTERIYQKKHLICQHSILEKMLTREM